MFSHTLLGGEKSNWVVAFYGYGQSAAVYAEFYELIKEYANLIVVDNPMQDYTKDIHPKDFADYINELIHDYKIDSFQSVSFSMGSRLNLDLPIYFHKQLSKIILIAPDGIVTNFWNRAAVNTPWGRRLFKLFTNPGNLYLNTLLFFHKIGIVNKSLYAFSKWNMRDDKRRKSVYNAWMNMRLMRPKLAEVNEALEDNGIQMTTYFGQEDPVITLEAQSICKTKFPSGKHQIIDADHNILTPSFFKILATEIEQ